ncbi:MAG: 1-acyl-sn-glycerol-3-phosphate acyltransferase [Cyanobacteria bacterium P01_A01_bin.135]
MPHIITRAKPTLAFIPPRYTPAVRWLSARIIPIWLRQQLRIVEVELVNGKALAQLYQDFETDKARFLLAFRHPTVDDPPCIAHALWNKLPQAAAEAQIPLSRPLHTHFVYERGIPLWAGRWTGWLFSRLGGTPIRRGTLDSQGLRSIRELFATGEFPVAIAPEGATNGHNELVSPIEPGIAQFGFWCMDALDKADRDEAVLIVPLGVQYHFVTEPWGALVERLAQLEADSGLSAPKQPTLQDGQPPTPEEDALLYQRLLRLGKHLLTQVETFYQTYYGYRLPSLDDAATPEATTQTNSEFAARLKRLLDTALTVAEESFGITAKGSLSDRCRRVEQAGWDRIYRDEVKASPLEQGLNNLVAEEADLRIWHMRLVESLVSVTGRYVAEARTIDRYADTTLLMWKIVNQICGRRAKRRYLGDRTVTITVGEPLPISQWREAYRENRRQAVADLTQKLQVAMEALIL